MNNDDDHAIEKQNVRMMRKLRFISDDIVDENEGPDWNDDFTAEISEVTMVKLRERDVDEMTKATTRMTKTTTTMTKLLGGKKS